jgi:hypothetical protein
LFGLLSSLHYNMDEGTPVDWVGLGCALVGRGAHTTEL